MLILRDVHDLVSTTLSSSVQDENEQSVARQRHNDGRWTLGMSRETGMVKVGYFPTNYVTELRVHWMSNEETDSQIETEMKLDGMLKHVAETPAEAPAPALATARTAKLKAGKMRDDKGWEGKGWEGKGLEGKGLEVKGLDDG